MNGSFVNRLFSSFLFVLISALLHTFNWAYMQSIWYHYKYIDYFFFILHCIICPEVPVPIKCCNSCRSATLQETYWHKTIATTPLHKFENTWRGRRIEANADKDNATQYHNYMKHRAGWDDFLRFKIGLPIFRPDLLSAFDIFCHILGNIFQHLERKLLFFDFEIYSFIYYSLLGHFQCLAWPAMYGATGSIHGCILEKYTLFFIVMIISILWPSMACRSIIFII